jgi:hypothetical protein
MKYALIYLPSSHWAFELDPVFTIIKMAAKNVLVANGMQEQIPGRERSYLHVHTCLNKPQVGPSFKGL